MHTQVITSQLEFALGASLVVMGLVTERVTVSQISSLVEFSCALLRPTNRIDQALYSPLASWPYGSEQECCWRTAIASAGASGSRFLVWPPSPKYFSIFSFVSLFLHLIITIYTRVRYLQKNERKYSFEMASRMCLKEHFTWNQKTWVLFWPLHVRWQRRVWLSDRQTQPCERCLYQQKNGCHHPPATLSPVVGWVMTPKVPMF